tara:strand:- start:1011 stop:1952 length:942 start_codon:yes stop_codon:yes gene_type:complete
MDTRKQMMMSAERKFKEAIEKMARSERNVRLSHPDLVSFVHDRGQSYGLVTNPDMMSRLRELSLLIDKHVLNRQLTMLVNCDAGLVLLAQSPHLQHMITEDGLNKVVDQIASPAEMLLSTAAGRELLMNNSRLCEMVSDDAVNVCLYELVTVGCELLRASPNLTDKISAEKLNYYNGVDIAVYPLLLSREGQEILNGNIELCHKIDSGRVNDINTERVPFHLFGRVGPVKYRNLVCQVIVYDILTTEHGRKFLETNDCIRSSISDEALYAEIECGPNRGKKAADLLMQPGYEVLRDMFLQDRNLPGINFNNFL